MGSYPKTTKGSDQELAIYEVNDENNINCSFLRDEDYSHQAFLGIEKPGEVIRSTKFIKTAKKGIKTFIG